jgi:hypothetical protein
VIVETPPSNATSADRQLVDNAKKFMSSDEGKNMMKQFGKCLDEFVLSRLLLMILGGDVSLVMTMLTP